jgi:hypothetical protein
MGSRTNNSENGKQKEKEINLRRLRREEDL